MRLTSQAGIEGLPLPSIIRDR